VIRMIITITGALGSGKSTVAKLIAGKLALKHYSTGDFMREMAAKRGITLLELSKLAETDPTIDQELDQRQIALGQQEDNFVIDARLGWHFIPHSTKVFLGVEDHEAARRIFLAKRKDEDYNTTEAETLANLRKRKASEIKRYQEYYKVNYYNRENYDLVIHTDEISAQEVAQKIVDYAISQKSL
jgi:CMP/dCMP kinase